MIKSLGNIKEPKVSELGGKGYSLALLHNNKFSIPKGFVIVAEVFIEYLKQNNLFDRVQEIVSQINGANFQLKSRKLKSLVLSGKIPKTIGSVIAENLKRLCSQRVSVRSSAISEDSLKASFAGLHDTFLNIRPDPTLVSEYVKKCWASLFNERAVAYRTKNRIPYLEGMAVVVQKMIPASVSGITFSVHPTNHQVLLVETSYGLGDLIVSGKIVPDEFVIDRKTLKILEKRVGDKSEISKTAGEGVKIVHVEEKAAKRQALTDEEVRQVAKISLDVERIYKTPQDIEWCIYKKKVWLLQSRAITTSVTPAKVSLEQRIILKGIPASPGIIQGKVKILLNPHQVGKMKDGDILVTVMTNPLYLIAIQKAKAIVTDVGGMICHAAIIARELGIPCVVGTGNATKLLKDHNEVIVNGTEGTVYASK
jgi:pyruvate,water dikinase